MNGFGGKIIRRHPRGRFRRRRNVRGGLLLHGIQLRGQVLALEPPQNVEMLQPVAEAGLRVGEQLRRIIQRVRRIILNQPVRNQGTQRRRAQVLVGLKLFQGGAGGVRHRRVGGVELHHGEIQPEDFIGRVKLYGLLQMRLRAGELFHPQVKFRRDGLKRHGICGGGRQFIENLFCQWKRRVLIMQTGRGQEQFVFHGRLDFDNFSPPVQSGG